MNSIISLNPYTLLSIINLKLRDYYKSLDDLCDDMNIDLEELTTKLLSIGYFYQETNNQFISTEK